LKMAVVAGAAAAVDCGGGSSSGSGGGRVDFDELKVRKSGRQKVRKRTNHE
jgi:hypothetical protein